MKPDNKILSLQKAFKQIYGEALEPLGFKKIKSRYPYFVRVVDGGEIIHIITYRNEPCFEYGYKKFNVFGGIATVYRQFIDLIHSPSFNINWLKGNYGFYNLSNTFNFDNEFSKSIHDFCYKADDENSIINSVKHSLKTTSDIMLPIFNEVIDIDSCIKYHHKYKFFMSLYDDEYFGNNSINSDYDDGYIYLMTDNYNDLIKEDMQNTINITAHNVKIGKLGYSQKQYDDLLNSSEEKINKQIEHRDKFFKDVELKHRVWEELERRKIQNTETLRSYGLNL